jgi:hypothetical protein
MRRGSLRALRLVLHDLEERIELVEHLLDRVDEQLRDEQRECPHHSDPDANDPRGST